MKLRSQEAYILVTRISKQRLLELCGIYGIEPDFVPDGNNHKIVKSRGMGSEFRVSIKSKKLHALNVQIDFAKQTIYVELIRSREGYNGVLISMLTAVVSAARMSGLPYIRLWAYGNYQLLKHWSGYLLWGKYGFLMEAGYKEKFLDLMIAHQREETTLYEVISKDEGFEFWKINGSDWWGRFFLYHSSESRKILAAALMKKRQR